MAPFTKCDNIVRFHYIIKLALDVSVQIKHLTWKYVFFKLKKKKKIEFVLRFYQFQKKK